MADQDAHEYPYVMIDGPSTSYMVTVFINPEKKIVICSLLHTCPNNFFYYLKEKIPKEYDYLIDDALFAAIHGYKNIMTEYSSTNQRKSF